MRRPNGGGREDGRSFLEFLALGVLAAVILSGLVTTGLQGTLGDGARSVICHIVAGHCDQRASGRSAQAGADDGRSPGDAHGTDHGKGKHQAGDHGKKDGKKDDCHGVFGCAWHYVEQYAGGVYGHAWSDVKGIWDHAVDTYHDPWGTTKATWAGLVAPWTNNFKRAWHRWQNGEHAKAVGMLYVENITEPYVIVYHSIVDDQVRKDWNDGNYAGAAGGLAYNIVFLIIPGGEEVKGASAGSKIARGAEKGAGKEAGEKAGAKAGEKAGKDAGKEPRGKGDGKDKGKAKKAVACGAPAAYSGRPGGAPIFRADLRVPAPAPGAAAGVPASRSLVLAKPKACNLPSYKDIKIDIGHIRDRHTPDGKVARQSGKKDAFPREMSDREIENSVRQAYRNGKRIGSQPPDRVKVRGTYNGQTIDMWVNTSTKTIETAYPVH